MREPDQQLERTCFQSAAPYDPTIHVVSDVAIVYGVDDGLPARMAGWKAKGYIIHVMTGVSWGNYQDYLYGRFDGQNHEDEAQTDRDGNRISHGGDVYYMSPTPAFGRYLASRIRIALEAGTEAIHLEEPEFWIRGGYSPAFQREWRRRYREDWQPPHSSADARWRSSKLMYELYRDALQTVFSSVVEYNKRTGRSVRCYVPTHSLLNYAHWRIVSPESSLSRLEGCDGYIAQVWTGTARTPNVYKGVLKERTFETAFLEYGVMQNLVRSTGRRVWYLNDPVEDNPRYDWEDYRVNWRGTLVASLLQPEVWRYETMPWPDRIFRGKYPSKTDPSVKEPMPADYATELQIVCNALNHMNQRPTRWDSGTQGFGVLVADTLMFQRDTPHASDPHMGHVYGMAMPLVKRGMPVTPVQLENARLPGYLQPFKALFLSYEGQKPPEPELHAALADWVRSGGVLVVCDDDTDPYLNVREWWNTGSMHYATPREHLFEQLGVNSSREGWTHVGRGYVCWKSISPTSFTRSADGDRQFCDLAREAAGRARMSWRETNYLILRRGRYVVAAGVDESPANASKRLTGRFVNLFDHALALQTQLTIEPGGRYLLLDIDRTPSRGVNLLASAGIVIPMRASAGAKRWRLEGCANTLGITLLKVDARPVVLLDGAPATDWDWDEPSGLLRVRYPNRAEGHLLEVRRA